MFFDRLHTIDAATIRRQQLANRLGPKVMPILIETEKRWRCHKQTKGRVKAPDESIKLKTSPEELLELDTRPISSAGPPEVIQKLPTSQICHQSPSSGSLEKIIQNEDHYYFE
jgi:hypothetical protein